MAGPIDEFCEALRSDLHARRARSHAELEQLHQLIRDLAKAREAAFVAEFATPLNLRVPTYTGPSAGAVHVRLRAAVEALTEASGREQQPSPATAASPAPSKTGAADRLGLETAPRHYTDASNPGRTGQPVSAENNASIPRWPTLEGLVGDAPIVVVGGSRGDKLAWLPPALRAAVEWVETTRQGTHAIGNLAQRIRQRRVLALIVLDGVVGHKHSEPLVTAAREVKIPTAYANKGGTGALARAFTQLEKMVGAP